MDLLDRLLKHDAWTTRQLLAVSAALDDEQLDREFDIAFRTVRKTLNHLVGNMRCWTDIMIGAKEVRFGPGEGATIDELSRCFEEVSVEFYRLARRVADEGRLNDTYTDHLDDPPMRKTFGGTIVHLTTHSMHHRAQLIHMLRRLGATGVPEGDALSWERLHTGGWERA